MGVMYRFKVRRLLGASGFVLLSVLIPPGCSVHVDPSGGTEPEGTIRDDLTLVLALRDACMDECRVILQQEAYAAYLTALIEHEQCLQQQYLALILCRYETSACIASGSTNCGGSCPTGSCPEPVLSAVDDLGECIENCLGSADPYCDRGIRNGSACCSASCGACGGSNCSSRPGGADACCSGRINSTGFSCTEGGPPCVVSDPACLLGIEGSTVCCAASCGQCGGSGCGSRPGGSAACCINTILSAGNSCSGSLPPCVK
jgi:hypothetical protein